MAINLIRNSRVFFTTNVNATSGVINTSGFTVNNTCEIQVLDGFSFSQATNADTITLNEAGATPNRGQRSFNTSLAPVEFSFSTYIRPTKRWGTGSTVGAEERFLWNALVSNAGTASYEGSSAAPDGGAWVEATTGATLDMSKSQAHQLIKFGLIIQADGTTYMIDDCCMNQASIDFGIDAIAMVAWSGMGKYLRRLSTAITLTDVAGYTGSFSAESPHVGFSVGYTGSALAKDTNAQFIANKLSTAYVGSGLDYAYIGSGTWAVPVTGGNITISNNITYLTPAILGVVNEPVTYFTGTRSVTGTLTAYLKSGTAMDSSTAGDTGDLMTDILSRKSQPDNKYTIQVDLGGISNALNATFKAPAAVLQVPTVKSEAVMGVDINFTAQGFDDSTQDFNIEGVNEFELTYRAP